MSSSKMLRLDMKSPVGKAVVFYCFSCKKNVQPASSSSDTSGVFCGACRGAHIVPRRNTLAKKKCWEAAD